MAAILTFANPRVDRRHSIELPETFKRIRSSICEGLLLLWMLGATAFSLLMAAGAMGLLS